MSLFLMLMGFFGAIGSLVRLYHSLTSYFENIDAALHQEEPGALDHVLDNMDFSAFFRNYLISGFSFISFSMLFITGAILMVVST